MKSFTALALALAALSAAVPSAAGEDCLKQGDFALALAEKVRLAAAGEAVAVKSLTDTGIRPADGWNPPAVLDEKVFGEIDRAVILAFAEGKLATGNPSVARAVLAGFNMSGTCRQRHFITATAVTTPDMPAAPLPAEDAGGDRGLEFDTPRQERTTPGRDPGAGKDDPGPVAEGPGEDPPAGGQDPSPGAKDPMPGVKEPAPGEKEPDPISPIGPSGPDRPGPGVK